MADENTQQPTTPVAPPSDDWKAKYEAQVAATQAAQQLAAEKERQYNSVQGNLTKAVDERRKAQDELKTLSESTELTKAEYAAEKARLEADLAAKTQAEADLKASVTKANETLEVLTTITTKYPALADLYGRGRLRTDGLKGEALETFLKEWNDDVSMQKLGLQRQEGNAPPPPNGQQTPMTFDEIVDAKSKALRDKGIRSSEFQMYAKMEEQAIKEGRHKSR
jgi:hypothetical protein